MCTFVKTTVLKKLNRVHQENVSLSCIFFGICVLILHVVDTWLFDFVFLDRGLQQAWRPTVSARALENHR